MSPPEVWGPPIWTLFHVLAEKINERAYPFYVGQIFRVIKMICSALPCPECTQDATIFLNKIKLQDLKIKNDFKNMIYLFHNHVNVKKRKYLYNYANLEIYNIIHVLNRFISVYHTRGNMNLLAESFQRQLIVKNVKNWFSNNIRIFAPSPPVNNSVPVVESASEDENIVIVEFNMKSTVITSEEPIIEPSIEPIMEPTIEPSVEPTIEPTIEPTAVTSEEPEVLEPIIEPTAVTSEEPEVLEPIMESTVEQNIEEQTIIEPQKTKKNKKKKTA